MFYLTYPMFDKMLNTLYQIFYPINLVLHIHILWDALYDLQSELSKLHDVLLDVQFALLYH